MSLLEIISRLCDVTGLLSEIVKKQQIIIEQAKIESAVREELQKSIKRSDEELDMLEYRMRKYCDTDDKYPYGKPQTDEVARGSGNREYGCRRLREKLPNFSGVSFF